MKNLWKQFMTFLKTHPKCHLIYRYTKGTICLISYLIFIAFRFLCLKLVSFLHYSWKAIKWLAKNGWLIFKAILKQLIKVIGLILFDGFRAGYDQIHRHQNSFQENAGRIIASGILLWSMAFFGYNVSASTISSLTSGFANPTLTAKQQKDTVNHIQHLKRPNDQQIAKHTTAILPNQDYMPQGVQYVTESPLAGSSLLKGTIKTPTQYQNGKLRVVNKLFVNPANDDERFINKLVVPAQIAALSYGVNPSVVIAQAYVESQHGQSVLAAKYQNYFGIKYNGTGQKVNMPTNEETSDGSVYRINADFQVYDNLEDSMAANTALLRNGISGQPQRYAGSWTENTQSYRDETKNLTQNYATATEYGTILNKFIETYGLYVLDAHPVHNPDLIKSVK